MVVDYSLSVQLLERVKNTLDPNDYQIKICFKLFLVSRMVKIAFVELSGELMQEIQHI